MKLTVLQFEGTAEELDASEAVQQLIANHGAASTIASTPTAEAVTPPTTLVPGVADEGQETVLGLLRRNPAAEHFVSFLAETTTWENVEVHGIKRRRTEDGAPLDYTEYLRVRRVGSPKGAFAYVYAFNGVINLRLPYDTEEALLNRVAPDAYKLDGGSTEYRISVQIVDKRTLKQALQLAKVAYDRT
ncbi:hypothetical protein [Streptomyces sp. NPDC056682]|uniref:hypothetical protein n=1 Tax=Streptomyces sp. NPDC056682 TaxID=3345909 RepID=UPI003682CE20